MHSLQISANQAIMTNKNNTDILHKQGDISEVIAYSFSDLWSHYCKGSEKNSCHSFSTILFLPATKTAGPE
jgi:hypothetical protein